MVPTTKKKRKKKVVRWKKADWIKWKEIAEKQAYDRGLADGRKQADKETKDQMLMESFKARLELGKAFASAFEGITRSASMFFDGGANCFR